MPSRAGLHDFLLRCPADLWANFVATSKIGGRSPTAQLIALMHDWLAADAAFCAFYTPGQSLCPKCQSPIKLYGRKRVRCVRLGCRWLGLAGKRP